MREGGAVGKVWVVLHELTPTHLKASLSLSRSLSPSRPLSLPLTVGKVWVVLHERVLVREPRHAPWPRLHRVRVHPCGPFIFISPSIFQTSPFTFRAVRLFSLCPMAAAASGTGASLRSMIFISPFISRYLFSDSALIFTSPFIFQTSPLTFRTVR